MVKVSVIIPTYNSEKSITRAVISVLNQAGIGKDFTIELIVVDDCSVDNTVEILKKFGGILFYKTPENSGGPNKGRNIGLKNASGDYICLLDHDDTWEPQKLRLQLKAAENFPIVTCGYEVTNAVTGLHAMVGDSDSRIISFKPNETFLKKLSKEKTNVQHVYMSTIMIHRSLKHIFFEENFGMLDFDWILRLFEGRPSAEVSANLVSRSVNHKNLSLNDEYRKRDYYCSLMVLETYEKMYSNEVVKGIRRTNGSRARYYYLVGEMRKARRYLLKAMPGLKELLYYLTSFFGSTWVKKRFVIFG